mmetsp:Transcript_1996/g.3619  ORF Transcript_1996/g.3619 Transcript_1996/m.3619 type:complete len:94 (-) Transcript_1996:1161-1442(-)
MGIQSNKRFDCSEYHHQSLHSCILFTRMIMNMLHLLLLRSIGGAAPAAHHILSTLLVNRKYNQFLVVVLPSSDSLSTTIPSINDPCDAPQLDQ